MTTTRLSKYNISVDVVIVMLTEKLLDSGLVYRATFLMYQKYCCVFSDLVNEWMNLHEVSCNLMKQFLKVVVNTILLMTFKYSLKRYSGVFSLRTQFPFDFLCPILWDKRMALQMHILASRTVRVLTGSQSNQHFQSLAFFLSSNSKIL